MHWVCTSLLPVPPNRHSCIPLPDEPPVSYADLSIHSHRSVTSGRPFAKPAPTRLSNIRFYNCWPVEHCGSAFYARDRDGSSGPRISAIISRLRTVATSLHPSKRACKCHSSRRRLQLKLAGHLGTRRRFPLIVHSVSARPSPDRTSFPNRKLLA